MEKNNIIVFDGAKTKKKGTQADKMRGIARYMRQQADLIEKGTKILERDAASYLTEVGLDFDEFTLSDNSVDALIQMFTGMADGKLENKQVYGASFFAVIEDERYFLKSSVYECYYDENIGEVSFDFTFSIYKADTQNECSFFNWAHREWEHIETEDVPIELELFVDEETLISEHQEQLTDIERLLACKGEPGYKEDVGKMRMVGSLIDAYGMVSDKDVEDALEKNKELNTVFSDEDCRVVHKRNTRGYYSREGDIYRIPDDCEGIAISYRDGQFRLCQFLDMDVLEEICTVYLQREKFPYVDLIAESSVAIREVWATPDKNKIVAAVKKMARAESEFIVPLSENTWIDVNGEFDLRRLQAGHYTKGKRSLGKKEELNLAHLLKCMEAVEESNVF